VYPLFKKSQQAIFSFILEKAIGMPATLRTVTSFRKLVAQLVNS
jgi:hypothetical protein